MSKEKLTQSRLKELIHYEPDTGVFTWINPTSTRMNSGDVAGCIDEDGYLRICIDRRIYRASRLAWLYQEGYFPEHFIDHENRIRDDNSWQNLRHVSCECNNRNRCVHTNNSSGITGVSWYKRYSKWRVQINVNRKKINIGYFDSKTEAAQARWEAEKKYNFPNCNSTSRAYLFLKERM